MVRIRIGGKGMTREHDRIQENANKYIVKNCPCYMNQPEADCWADQLSWCENCTDCVIKQVIEVCKKETVINYPKKEKEFITVNGYQAILNMFNIEEINK